MTSKAKRKTKEMRQPHGVDALMPCCTENISQLGYQLGLFGFVWCLHMLK